MKDNRILIRAARIKLETEAMKYARMKSLGMHFDANGNNCKPFPADAVDVAKMYGEDLLRAAVDLFAEVAATPLPDLPVDKTETVE